LREWKWPDSDTGEDLAEEIHKNHIPDFPYWKNHDDFKKALARQRKRFAHQHRQMNTCRDEFNLCTALLQ